MKDTVKEERIVESDKMAKRALGKGLSALLAADDDESVDTKENTQQHQMPLSQIKPGGSQPRRHFEQNSLDELSNSIKKHGVLQPIIVRKDKTSDLYEIIAGERRYRAAKLAGLTTIPVIVKDIDDKQAMELALIENIQREDLTPIEEAEGYKRLQDEFGYTQEQLGGILEKSRSHIANMLRLLSLPKSVKEMVNSGKISMSHARVLVGAQNAEILAEKIINEALNVRETENLALGRGHAGGGAKGKKLTNNLRNIGRNLQKDEDLLALERSLSETLGLKVIVEDSNDGGRVILHFNNLTELDKILQKIG